MHPLNYFAVYIWKTWQDYNFGKYLSKQCGTHYFWRYRRTLQLYTAIFCDWMCELDEVSPGSCTLHSTTASRVPWFSGPYKSLLLVLVRTGFVLIVFNLGWTLDNQSTDLSRGNCWRSNIWRSSITSNASKALHAHKKTWCASLYPHALNPQSCAVLVGTKLLANLGPVWICFLNPQSCDVC